MEVKLIDFIFFTFRISIIITKEEKTNIHILNTLSKYINLKSGYESLVIVDGRKRRKLETLETLLVKTVRSTRGLFLYYGIFASLNQDNIIESVLNGIKQYYKSEKIKLQRPYIISSKDYTVNKIDSEIIQTVINSRKTDGNMAFYSIL